MAPGVSDARLLDLIQRDFPSASRPYAELARRLAESGGPTAAGRRPGEAEVYATVRRLREQGLIRRLGGIFDSRALGFHTTLAAAAVPPERLEEVAGQVSAYPEVTHNYAREGELNLWFTLVAPTLERATEVLRRLAGETGVAIHDFPAERVYKREVLFRFSRSGDGPDGGVAPAVARGGTAEAPGVPATATRPDPTDRRLIAALQGDLPAGLEPYAEVGSRLGLGEAEVFRRIEAFRRRGWLRRLAAVLAHRQAGVLGNAMVVWDVPEPILDQVGEALARCEAVTHCYARSPAPGWPYRLYSMVHAPTREEALRLVHRIASSVNAQSHRVLFSTREFKKTSPTYYHL